MSGELTTQEHSMTREELDAFSQKLELFTDGLTPKERALLLQVLMRAGADDPEDVEAHEMRRWSLAAAALTLEMEWKQHSPGL
jgi:hypothetical protein